MSQSNKAPDLNINSKMLKHLPVGVAIAIRRTKFAVKLFPDYFRDFMRHLKFSGSAGFYSYDQVYSKITATYHNIEKGLAMPNPRPGFGAVNLRYLLDLLAIPGIDEKETSVLTARNVLAAYLDLQKRIGAEKIPYEREIHDAVAKLADKQVGRIGGTRQIKKDDILAATQGVDDGFFLNRFSIRQFSDVRVDLDQVKGAIGVALKAPAVCNRQNGFVYVVQDPAVRQALLDFQGGSRGFGEGIDTLLIVTSRLSNFWGSGERHQAWVDGGMFSMALIYGLHARNLGTVALNWSRSVKDTEKLAAMIGMKHDEVVMMMVGVGNLRDEFSVAISNRNDIDLSHAVVRELTPS